MSATGLLLLLIGLWIILNTPNLVGVVNGTTKLGLTRPNSSTSGGHSQGGTF